MEIINFNKADEEFFYDVCDNGMPVYLWVNNKGNNFYATLNVKFGSVDTEFKVGNEKKWIVIPNGVAHFLEHIKFNMEDGTNAFDKFAKLGSNPNAFTTFDFTCYEVFGNSDLEENLKLLIDYVTGFYLTDELLEKERGIILEEVKMGEDNNNSKFYFESNKAIFKNNKRKYEIAGTVNDVKKIKKDDIIKAFNTFYQPNNMFMVVTGNFNPYQVMALINEEMNKWNIKEKKIVRKSVKEDCKVVLEEKEVYGKCVEIPKFNVSYKIDRNLFKEYKNEELNIYFSIILGCNFGATSLFKEELLERELIIGLNYNINIVNDVILLSIKGSSKYPKEVVKLIKDKMQDLSVEESRIKAILKMLWGNIIWGFDDVEYVNSMVQSQIVSYNKFLNDIYSLYKNINYKDVNAIIDKIDLTNCSVIYLMNEKK